MKKKIIILILILIILTVGIFSALIFLGVFNTNYVLKVGNIKISPSEYKIYLYEQKKFFEETGEADIWEVDIDGTSAEDIAKQNTINSIVTVKSALQQADKLNIKLSDSDYQTITSEAEKFYNELGSLAEKLEITYDDVYDVMEESNIQRKVFDYIANGFVIDENDFNEYYETYFNENKADLVPMKIKYIFVGFDKDKKNYDKAYSIMLGIRSKLANNEDFDTLIEKYSQSNEKSEINMKKGLFEDNVEEAVCTLGKTGDVSDIIVASNGFYIVKATYIPEVDMQAIKENAKEEYIQNKKDELYQEQSKKWSTDFAIEKNDELYSSINISDLN